MNTEKKGKFECEQQVCYDTGHAVLEYGHNPGPQILLAKKKTATSPETSDAILKKKVQQVRLDSENPILEGMSKTMATADTWQTTMSCVLGRCVTQYSSDWQTVMKMTSSTSTGLVV